MRTGWSLTPWPTPKGKRSVHERAAKNEPMAMSNIIPGFVAALLLVVFLGFYAVRLNSLALWVIIWSVLAMVIVDYVQSVRSDGNKNSRLARAGRPDRGD